MAGPRCYTGVIDFLHTLPTQKSLRVLGSSQGLMGAPMGVAHITRDRHLSIKRGARPAGFLVLESSDKRTRDLICIASVYQLTNILEYSLHSSSLLPYVLT